jgi:long-subunit fatty acid transport protein
VADLSLLVRAGYAFEPSPVPEQSAATNFLDSDRHLLAGGAAVQLAGLEPWVAGGLELGVAYQAGFLQHRRYEKPTEAEASYGLGGNFWSVTADLSVQF